MKLSMILHIKFAQFTISKISDYTTFLAQLGIAVDSLLGFFQFFNNLTISDKRTSTSLEKFT